MRKEDRGPGDVARWSWPMSVGLVNEMRIEVRGGSQSLRGQTWVIGSEFLEEGTEMKCSSSTVMVGA